ncbi:MAG: phosphoribosylglycinamide formyltransferase [Nitrospinota bacterium]
MRVAVFASGRGSNLQALMDAADSGFLKAEIVCVLSDVREAKALERAARRGIPSRSIERGEFERTALQILNEFRVDLVCLAGFMRILSGEFIEKAGVRILNVHPSLLPAFPGLRAQRQALEHGVRITGATVHCVDEQVDHGPVIVQAAVPVFQDDDEATVSERILREEHRIYPMAVRWFAEGRIVLEGRRMVLQNASQAEFSVRNPDNP